MMVSIPAGVPEADQVHIPRVVEEMEQSPELVTLATRIAATRELLDRLNLLESALARQYGEALLLAEGDPVRVSAIEALLMAHLEVVARKIDCYRQMNEAFGCLNEEAEKAAPGPSVSCSADTGHVSGNELQREVRHWMQATGMAVTLLRSEWAREHRMLDQVRKASRAIQ